MPIQRQRGSQCNDRNRQLQLERQVTPVKYKTVSKIILCLLICAVSYGAVHMERSETQLLMENDSLTMRLVASRNYNFNFVDKNSKMSMFSSSVWYHGRNEDESEHFYKDQDEASWPVSSLSTSKNGLVSEAVLLSGNHEVGLRRVIRMYDDCEAITARYELSALQTREYPSINFPIVRFPKEVDSVSFNIDPELEIFGHASMPTEAQVARSHVIFLHSSAYKRTILVMPNLNVPLENGETVGLAAKVSDSNWCKTLSFNHLYLPVVNFRKAGEYQVFECSYAVLDGDTLTEEHKETAKTLLKRLNIRPPSFTMKGINEDQSMPSTLAGLIGSAGKLKLWQEISSKRVHPETALPTRNLPEIIIKAARREAESVQLVLNGAKGMKVEEVKAHMLTDSQGRKMSPLCVETQWLEYQEQNNSFSRQGMSTQIGDKLLPLASDRSVKFENQVLWLTITISDGQQPGDYAGIICLKLRDKDGSAIEFDIPLKIIVWNFSLPLNPNFTCYGLLWETPQEMRKATMDIAAKYRHTTTVFHGGNKQLKNNFDGKELNMPENFDLAEYAVKNLNFNITCIPYLFFGAWNWSPGKNVHFMGLDPESPEFKPIVTSYISSCFRQFKQRGIEQRLVAYMWDEVTQPMYDMLKQTSELCRQVAPEVRVLTVGAPDEMVLRYSEITVAGSICNWWGEIARKRIETASAEGKEVWLYQNGVSYSPVKPLLTTRNTTWRCWGLGLTGYLQWTMDYKWNGNFSNNGLTWLFYPPVEAGVPVASVRLPVMRDSIDDFDYLTIAKQNLQPDKWIEIEKLIMPLVNPDTKPDFAPETICKAREIIGQALSDASL